MRQLNFLHHILSQAEDDPVKIVYKEQLKFDEERNWGNEIATLRASYQLTETDDEIRLYTKERWKKLVKSHVRKHALECLNAQMSAQKHDQTV